MAKEKPETVSSKPLFDWFDADKVRRPSFIRATGYSDGRVTNWKARGLPRGEVGKVAAFMGLDYEQYMATAGAPTIARQPGAAYKAISEEALEIARAFDQLKPQTRERIREHVFLYSIIEKSFPWLRTGKPVSENYAAFEKWHEENMRAQLALEAARIGRGKTTT